LAEDEFKTKLLQSEDVISSLKKQLETKEEILRSNTETQKQLQATINGQTKTEETSNRTVQELREKGKQLQATIDGLTKTVETLNQTVKMLCWHPNDVSTCKVEAVTTCKCTEIPPVYNIFKVLPKDSGFIDLLCFRHQGLCRYIHKPLMFTSFNANFISVQH
jgi:uncharacterized FlaG/YvyC family protein